VQDVLARALALENPSTYIEHVGNTMTSGTSSRRSRKRADCALLLHVNNI